MFVRCCVCGASLPSVPVELGDPADGMISHGYCGPCERQAMAEVDAMQIPIVREVEPADAREELRAEAYLTGLGLLDLPGGFWAVLFIPYALLALAGGR